MPLSPTSSRGSSGSFGAVIYLSAAANPLGGSTKVPFDTVDFDVGGFFSAADHGFKVPAGKAGWYRFAAVIATSADAGATAALVTLNFAAEPVLFSPYVTGAHTGYGLSVSIVSEGQFAVGDVIDCRFSWDGTASPAIATQSQFSCQYLGAAA